MKTAAIGLLLVLLCSLTRAELSAEEGTIRVRLTVGTPLAYQITPLDPAIDFPIGVGDLLRYNAMQPRPIAIPYSAGLHDLNDDGQLDLTGTWNYAYRPGGPWDGIVCFATSALPPYHDSPIQKRCDALANRFESRITVLIPGRAISTEMEILT